MAKLQNTLVKTIHWLRVKLAVHFIHTIIFWLKKYIEVEQTLTLNDQTQETNDKITARSLTGHLREAVSVYKTITRSESSDWVYKNI